MVDNPKIPEDQTTEEQTPQTYDDRLARDLYKNYSSQNAITIQLTLIGSLSGITYTKEVINAYNLLAKPLDPQKLISDPKYSSHVERALRLVKRHEGGKLKKGTSKYTQTVKRTTVAFSQVKATHQRLNDNYLGLTKQYGVDIRRIYGLEDKDLETVHNKALQRMKEYPNQFTLQEAMRLEARNASIQKTATEVESDKSIGKRNKKQEAEKRVKELNLNDKNKEYLEATSKIADYEKEKRIKVINEGLQSVTSTLGAELKPAVESQQPSITAQPASSVLIPQTKTAKGAAPAVALSKPTAQVAPPLSQPTIAVPTIRQIEPVVQPASSPPLMPIPPSSALSTPPAKPVITLPKVSLPRISFSGKIGKVVSSFNKVGDLGNMLGKFTGNLLKIGLKKIGKKFLQSALFKTALSVILPGVGTIASIGLSLLQKIPVINRIVDESWDITKKAVVVVIICIFILAILLPMVFVTFLYYARSPNLFSFNAQKPFVVGNNSLDNTQKLSWNDFERKYLVYEKRPKNIEYGWSEFEKKYLIPSKEFLSLEQR